MICAWGGAPKGAFLRVAAIAAVVGMAVTYVMLGAGHPWDFETYYYAAKDQRAGLDPYQPSALSTAAGKRVELPYIYPPIGLVPFLPLSRLPLGSAAAIRLTLNAAAALAVLAIRRRALLARVSGSLLVAVAILGLDLALL